MALERVLARLTRRRGPEASAPFRVAVLATVLVAVGAAAVEGAVRPGAALLALVLIPPGYVLSSVRRERRNLALKGLLATALLVAFGGFLRAVGSAASLEDVRVPLAELFLWVQVLHSYDLPRRRDLNFSLAASLTLVAMAGAASLSTRFGALLLLYVAAAGAALALGHLSELRERAGDGAARAVTPPGTRRAPRGLAAPLGTAGAGVAALSLLVFLALPRLPGARVTVLPWSIATRTPVPGFGGQVYNPGLRSAAGGFSPTAYFGYGDALDLRVRGRLSEEVVLRVRSPEGAFWRGQVYDRYDQGRWTSTDDRPARVRAGWNNTIELPVQARGHEVVQTFYVERELPNLVFHAFQARELFTPATSVAVDAFGSIRLPFVLEPDTIYSVVSVVPDARAEDLRSAPPPDAADPALARYLQLPPSLPERVRELGRRLAQPHATTLDTVTAVQAWLRDHTRYRLDIPRDPPGRDPVDVFLFDRREGFCEQVASAMAVLLRAAGIPARLAAGFTEGKRNPFTGLWEVRNADAHTWVEVLYPGVGWIPYDPTHEVPDAASRLDDLFVLRPLAAFVAGIVPAWARQGGRVLGGVLPALGASVLALAALALVQRRAGRREPWGPRGRAAAAWGLVERALARRGLVRRPHETANELAARACARAPDLDRQALQRLVEGFARARYGPAEPDEQELGELERLAARLAAGIARWRPPAFTAPRP